MNQNIEIPEYLKDCPIFFDWCTYKGKRYFGVLNLERSEQKQKPVIDLHYCATAALNNNLLEKTVTYSKKNFKDA